MALDGFCVFEEQMFQIDLHSGRSRSVSRGLFLTAAETIEDTWMSEALNAASAPEMPPLWMTVTRETRGLWTQSIGCKIGLPMDGLLSGLSSFRDGFSREAMADIVRDILQFSEDPHITNAGWRRYESALLREAIKSGRDRIIDAERVAEIREREFGAAMR